MSWTEGCSGEHLPSAHCLPGRPQKDGGLDWRRSTARTGCAGAMAFLRQPQPQPLRTGQREMESDGARS